MWSLCLVMSECSLSGRGQGHVSNFYTVDLENFATASRRYTGDIHKSSVVGLFMTHLRQWKRLGRIMVECTLPITHCLRLNLQLHTIDLVRTCRVSSFCSVAWQLARFQLTRRIARSLGDSWASCTFLVPAHPDSAWKGTLNGCVCVLALEMASPGNQHCANCIGTLSLPIRRPSSGALPLVPPLATQPPDDHFRPLPSNIGYIAAKDMTFRFQIHLLVSWSDNRQRWQKW